MFVSCSKLSSDTTYTFIESSSAYEYLIENCPAGVEVTVEYVISEYTSSGLRVGANMVRNLTTGKKVKFTATEGASYVTVKMQLELKEGYDVYSKCSYASNAFLLREGKNIDVEITDNTLFQSTEPK